MGAVEHAAQAPERFDGLLCGGGELGDVGRNQWPVLRDLCGEQLDSPIF
jgi:hypothetical protein